MDKLAQTQGGGGGWCLEKENVLDEWAIDWVVWGDMLLEVVQRVM